MSKEKFLVTSALPYANGPLHLGHIAGAYLPADIFVRFNKLKGNDVIYIGGTDEHGVPITIKAEQEKVSPQDIVNRYHKQISESFKNLNINFDNFSGTARDVHHKMSQEFFTNLFENGKITQNEIEQYYCNHDKMFLPDRFLTGVCPACQYEKARGDECPKCGKWLEPEKLESPKCKLCGNPPEMKKTTHWFLRLDLIQDELKEWIESKENLKDSVKQFALSWIREGLNERAITRDIKWGVPVPLDEAKGKVLYVWFDAPIGYISSTIEWAERMGKPDKWKDYWFDEDCKLVHFIGKDNVPFHIIVWPGLLMGQNEKYILPYDVPANEHLTIEGKKLSTSEGNVIWVDDFLKHFKADALRYYLASMAPETKDADFSWDGFKNKYNGELSNVLGNLVNRTLTFVNKNYAKIPEINEIHNSDHEILEPIGEFPDKVGKLLSNFKVREAVFEVIQLAHLGNKYFDSEKPWELIKTNKDRCGTVLGYCILMIKTICPMMYPFLPESSERLWAMIGETSPLSEVKWDEIKDLQISSGNELGKISLLFPKIDDKEMNKIIDEFHKVKEEIKGEKMEEEKKEEISIDDFFKVELKVGTVLEAEKVEKSNKLLKLQVKLGNETRQIVSGVAKTYKAEELIGKQVVVVSNLKKAKLMGIESEGMILFASHGDKLSMVSPVDQVEEGSQVS